MSLELSPTRPHTKEPNHSWNVFITVHLLDHKQTPVMVSTTSVAFSSCICFWFCSRKAYGTWIFSRPNKSQVICHTAQHMVFKWPQHLDDSFPCPPPDIPWPRTKISGEPRSKQTLEKPPCSLQGVGSICREARWHCSRARLPCRPNVYQILTKIGSKHSKIASPG